MTRLLAAGLVLGVVSVPQGPPADQFVLSAPATIVVVDTGKIKGEPRRLAWSPDGRTLYLQALKPGNNGQSTLRHYAVSLEKRTIEPLAGEPAWATGYWTRKSARFAPTDLRVSIEIDTTKEHIQGGPAVLGGAMSRSALTGQGSVTNPTPDVEEMADRNAHGQDVVTHTLRLKGEIVGAGEQGRIFPGQTFGWAPASLGSTIAFADPSGRVVIMDLEGRKQAVESSKGALLPAWSDDGTRIAYLQKSGKKTYDLVMVDVH